MMNANAIKETTHARIAELQERMHELHKELDVLAHEHAVLVGVAVAFDTTKSAPAAEYVPMPDTPRPGKGDF